MRTNVKSFLMVLLTVGAALSVSSCRDDQDLFDPTYNFEKTKFEYETAFRNAFGSISSTQSWDFTKYSTWVGTRAVSGNGTQNDPFDYSDPSNWSNDYFEVPTSIIGELQKTLPEGDQSNINKGSAFVFVVPDGDFSLTPIYQGGNVNTEVDFRMIVKKDDGTATYYNLWKRIFDDTSTILMKQKDSEAWTWPKESESAGGSTSQASAIKGKTITFKRGDLPIGATIEFYTQNKAKNNSLSSQKAYGIRAGDLVKWYSNPPEGYRPGDKKTLMWGIFPQDMNRLGILSLNNMTKPWTGEEKDQAGNYLHKSKVKGEWVEHGYRYISCEAGGDHDLNEIVFLMEGTPYLPEEITVVPGEPIKVSVEVTKRYMVEDLGASSESDIDFNDLVVDLYKKTTKTQTVDNSVDENGNIVSSTVGETTTTLDAMTATIRAMGGTMDFELYIDDVCVFRKGKEHSVGTMYNTSNIDKNWSYPVDLKQFQKGDGGYLNWDSDNHNIYVKVETGQSGNVSNVAGSSWQISWATMGSVPAMICVDDNQLWNKERVSVFSEGANLKLKDLAAE